MAHNPSDDHSSRDSAGGSRLEDILNALFSLHQAERSGQQVAGESGTISELTLRDMARLLGGTRVTTNTRPSHQHTMEGEDEDEEDDDEYVDIDDDEDDDHVPPPRRMRPFFSPVTEPKKEGVELLASGEFGRVGVKSRVRRKRFNVARTILSQGNHPVPSLNREELSSKMVPNTNGTTVATYDANMYTAQFSDDSSFFYTCAQDFKLHIFDMRAPSTPEPSPESIRSGHDRRSRHDSSLVTRMPLRKVIQGHPGRWTITDANLSPDNERMIYSSITPTVYMTTTSPEGSPRQIPIPFADPHSRASPFFGLGDSFGIWSCRFSADGNEVVAGGSGKIFVYDLLANKRTVKISAHSDDVNSCCWADTASGNILVSASDDTYIKVWDRRSLGASRRPSGVLVGHTEGITYVSAKGDGRYIISNGKDQATRLWDLRKMRSSAEFDEIQRDRNYYGIPEFDYRYPYYLEPAYTAHPKDCSVMTYRGHSVLRTLIRCHFSPAETTGQQYIYSGSADGKIHIWSLDGTIVHVLDRSKTLPASFSPSGIEPEPPRRRGLSDYDTYTCVRDVSWHTQESVMLSAGWEHARGGTVIARHEFKGLSKTTRSLEDWVEKEHSEAAEFPLRRSSRLRSHALHLPGSYFDTDEEEGDDED